MVVNFVGLREEHRLRALGNCVLRRILDVREKKFQKTGENYTVRGFIIYNISVIKSYRIRWIGHLVGMG
jgi:hypothetical protein